MNIMVTTWQSDHLFFFQSEDHNMLHFTKKEEHTKPVISLIFPPKISYLALFPPKSPPPPKKAQLPTHSKLLELEVRKPPKNGKIPSHQVSTPPRRGRKSYGPTESLGRENHYKKCLVFGKTGGHSIVGTHF